MKTRHDQEFLEIYKKDERFEKALNAFSTHLAESEDAFYFDNLSERHSTIHIVGPPRSGTTLLNQLLSTHIDIGYINNLIAAFWRTPLYGIILSKKLLGISNQSNFSSEFGKTAGIYEPHEFGYFWSYLLNYSDLSQKEPSHEAHINWKRLRNVLLNICNEFRSSVVFKSLFLGWHAQKVVEILPRSLFIHITREPNENAASLLKIRKKYFGSFEEWASLKPLEYDFLKNRHFTEQVVGQIFYLNKSYKAELDKIDSSNVLRITYEDLCDSPPRILEQVVQKLNALGVEQHLIGTPPSHFKPSNNNLPEDISSKLEEAINHYAF